MKKSFVVLSLLFSTSLPVAAETYSWTDGNGTVNFTEDVGSIPKKYRKKAKMYGDVSPSELLSSPIAKQQTVPLVKDSKTVSDSARMYDGKTFEQWKQILGDKENIMNDVKKRIDEMDTKIKKGGTMREVMQDRNRLVQQYNAMRFEYEKQVESARKAGLKVEMK